MQFRIQDLGVVIEKMSGEAARAPKLIVINIRRHEILLEEHAHSLRIPFQLGIPGPLMGLYHQSLSNAVAGYTFRSVEEMIFRKKLGPLDSAKRENFISSACSGSDLMETRYRDLKRGDPVDDRLLLALSLFWRERHREFILADDQTLEDWWTTIFSQSCEATAEQSVSVYRQAGIQLNLRDSDKEVLAQNVSNDISMGYIIKTVESLYPM